MVLPAMLQRYWASLVVVFLVSSFFTVLFFVIGAPTQYLEPVLNDALYQESNDSSYRLNLRPANTEDKVFNNPVNTVSKTTRSSSVNNVTAGKNPTPTSIPPTRQSTPVTKIPLPSPTTITIGSVKVSSNPYGNEALKQVLSKESLQPSLAQMRLSMEPNLKYNSVIPPGMDTGYNPVGPPTISFPVFRQFLAEGNSPALPEAAAMYNVCLREHCDPALALAFFEHESSLGTQGVAVQTRSIGNIRCTYDTPCVETSGNGLFKIYSSWTEGLQNWATLLRDTYLGSWKLATLEQILPTYAPGAQSIDYIRAVKIRVDSLRRRNQLS